MLKIPILYEDSSIVVIDKPAKIVSARANTVKDETLQDWMKSTYPDIWDKYADTHDDDVKYFVERLGLTHRLDKETTGVMVFSKTPEAFVSLLSQFREREVEKEYVALTHGIWKVQEGSIVLPLGRMRHNHKLFGVRTDGRRAETNYRVIAEFRDWNFPDGVDATGYQGFSLVLYTPKTGRTHQLRVHSAHIGHPVVADYLYAGKKRTREDRKWARRTLLHAKTLRLRNPGTKRKSVFTSKPKQINEVLREHFNYKG